ASTTSPGIRAAATQDLVGDRVHVIGGKIVQHKAGTGRRERDRPPQPVAGAGYSRRFAVEPPHGPSRSPGESTKRLLGARVTAGQPVAGCQGRSGAGGPARGGLGAGLAGGGAGGMQGGRVRAGQVRAGPGAVIPSKRIRRNPSTTWSAL